MKSILNVLDNAKRVPGGAPACEEILRQWQNFLLEKMPTCQSEFVCFKPNEEDCRVDVFLQEHLGSDMKYRKLWQVVKVLLSHGQATVERGFSTTARLKL